MYIYIFIILNKVRSPFNKVREASDDSAPLCVSQNSNGIIPESHFYADRYLPKPRLSVPITNRQDANNIMIDRYSNEMKFLAVLTVGEYISTEGVGNSRVRVLSKQKFYNCQKCRVFIQKKLDEKEAERAGSGMNCVVLVTVFSSGAEIDVTLGP